MRLWRVRTAYHAWSIVVIFPLLFGESQDCREVSLPYFTPSSRHLPSRQCRNTDYRSCLNGGVVEEGLFRRQHSGEVALAKYARQPST